MISGRYQCPIVHYNGMCRATSGFSNIISLQQHIQSRRDDGDVNHKAVNVWMGTLHPFKVEGTGSTSLSDFFSCCLGKRTCDIESVVNVDREDKRIVWPPSVYLERLDDKYNSRENLYKQFSLSVHILKKNNCFPMYTKNGFEHKAVLIFEDSYKVCYTCCWCE